MNPFRAKPLTRRRIVLACLLAVGADVVQIALGPLGWSFFDEIIDVWMMILASLLLGFHPLLLPTFVVEIVPVLDMLPTWTGCVLAVIALRKRQAPPSPPPSSEPAPSPAAAPSPSSGSGSPSPSSAPGAGSGPVIDVETVRKR